MILHLNLIDPAPADAITELDNVERVRQKNLSNRGLSKWFQESPTCRLQGPLPKASFIVGLVNRQRPTNTPYRFDLEQLAARLQTNGYAAGTRSRFQNLVALQDE